MPPNVNGTLVPPPPPILLSLENPVFRCYLFWMVLLLLKTLLMAILTAVQRRRTQTFANPEDVAMAKASEIKLSDPAVDRARRAHLNDLENIFPLLFIELAYIACGPHPTLARTLCRIAALARILHTAVYAFRPVPQPARSIAFFTTYLISIYMIIYVMVYTIMFI